MPLYAKNAVGLPTVQCTRTIPQRNRPPKDRQTRHGLHGCESFSRFGLNGVATKMTGHTAIHRLKRTVIALCEVSNKILDLYTIDVPTLISLRTSRTEGSRNQQNPPNRDALLIGMAKPEFVIFQPLHARNRSAFCCSVVRKSPVDALLLMASIRLTRPHFSGGMGWSIPCILRCVRPGFRAWSQRVAQTPPTPLLSSLPYRCFLSRYNPQKHQANHWDVLLSRHEIFHRHR